MRKERGENFCVIVNVVTWDWPRSFCVLCLRLGVVQRKVNLRDGAAVQRTIFFLFLFQVSVFVIKNIILSIFHWSQLCSIQQRISWNFCPYRVWTCGSRSHSIPYQFDLSCKYELQSNVIFAHIFANYYKDNLGQFQMFCFRDIIFSRMALSRLKFVVVGDDLVGEF